MLFLLKEWEYTVEKPYTKNSKIDIKKLYNKILKIPALKNELFRKPYIPYKNLKVTKDFNIKNIDLIQKLRDFHENKNELFSSTKKKKKKKLSNNVK
jgi:hypothetical protein